MPTLTVINIMADVPPELLSGPPGVRPCWRQLWFARRGDIVVSPLAIEPEFVAYVAATTGRDLTDLEIVIDAQLCNEASAVPSPETLALLRSHIIDPQEWSINRSYLTPSIAMLANELGIDLGDGGLAMEDGNEFVNRKANFRRLATSTGLPTAEGMVCAAPDSLVAAAQSLLPLTGAVIVKRDNGGGGYGNVVLTLNGEASCPGAREAIPVGDGDLGSLCRDVWARLRIPVGQSVVIEAYHRSGAPFYLEYFIDPSGQHNYLTSGDVLSQEVQGEPAFRWLGLQVPSSQGPRELAHAVALASPFVSLIAQLGYRGYLNVDCIEIADGRLLFNEINGRWGGGTVIHEVATALFGAQYERFWSFRLIRDLPYMDLKDAASALGLLAGPASLGLVMTTDPVRRSGMEVLIGAKVAGDLVELERQVQALWAAEPASA